MRAGNKTAVASCHSRLHHLEATTGFEPVMAVLQTAALGHLATSPLPDTIARRQAKPNYDTTRNPVIPQTYTNNSLRSLQRGKEDGILDF